MSLLSVGFAGGIQGPGGRIVNFSSGQSLGPMPESLAYAASKGAIEAFTRTLAAEVGHKGITVNAINPGPTDTGWMTEELKREIAPKFPSGRIGQPEDAARLVVFWPVMRRPGSPPGHPFRGRLYVLERQVRLLALPLRLA